MPHRLARPTSQDVRHGLAVGAVAVIAGVLFATNATVFAEEDFDRPTDLRSLVVEENDRLTALSAEVEELRGEVEDLRNGLPGSIGEPTAAFALAAGLSEVHGPGVVVTLTDAPAGASAPHVDDLVVHQQDLEAVMNALWVGGAEAVSIQGQRITARSAVRCVGNVLLLHGRTYSPPYRVEAVGDPDRLSAALEEDSVLTVYRQYVDAYGLGWNVNESDALTLPPYTGDRAVTHATVDQGAAL